MATRVEPALNTLDLLSRYEEVLRQSQRMIEAAQDGDWDSLIELERVRAEIYTALMDQERNCNDSSAAQSAKAALIRGILASDAETRRLIVPRQQELRMTFDSIDTEKKLLKAYATNW